MGHDSQKKSEKFLFFALVIIVVLLIGLVLANIGIAKLKRNEKKENVSNSDDYFLEFKKFLITDNGSLIKDLKISKETAMEIAISEELVIRNDIPIVHPGDIFVKYTLRTGESGWYKEKPEHLCLSFD